MVAAKHCALLICAAMGMLFPAQEPRSADNVSRLRGHPKRVRVFSSISEADATVEISDSSYDEQGSLVEEVIYDNALGGVASKRKILREEARTTTTHFADNSGIPYMVVVVEHINSRDRRPLRIVTRGPEERAVRQAEFSYATDGTLKSKSLYAGEEERALSRVGEYLYSNGALEGYWLASESGEHRVEAEFDYGPSGELTSKRIVTESGTTKTSYLYDDRGRLVLEDSFQDDSPISRAAYGHSPVDLLPVTKTVTLLGPDKNVREVRVNCFNEAGLETSSSRVVSGRFTEHSVFEYQYDSAGNWTECTTYLTKSNATGMVFAQLPSRVLRRIEYW